MPRLPPAHISQSSPGHTGIFEDDPVTLGVQVHNGSLLPGFLILLREQCPIADVDDRQREFIVTVVGPKSSITATHDITCYRRGVYTLPPFQVETSAPFGLFRARRTIDAPMEVTVYPRVLPFGTMTTKGLLQDHPRESAMPRPSGEVRGSREYLLGDQPSSIHWKNSARRGRLMVKEFDEAPQGAVGFAFNPGFLLGKGRNTTLEYSIKIAAGLARWCFQEGKPFRMWPSGKQHSAQNFQGVLEHLARIEVHTDHAIRALVSHGGSGTAIAVVSAADAETLQVLQASRVGTGCATVVLLEGFSPSALFTAYSPGFIALRNSPEGSDHGRAAQSSVEQLRQATEYRVVSAVPRLTPELLRSDFADRAYLRNVQSGAIPQRVRDLASALVAGATSDYEKAARIERYLLDNYQYDLRASAAPSSGEALESFLFERQAGYCAQFATAMAVMARAVDLPARVAIGYLPGKYDSVTGVHTVRLQDGHAWVEVKFNTFGWVPFDPTPRPDSPWAVDSGFTAATKSFQQVLRAEVGDLIPEAPLSGAAGLFSQQHAPRVALLASLAGILLIALTVIRVARKRQNRGHDPLHQYATLPGDGRNEVRRVYRKALRLLKRKGYPQQQAHQSPEDYLTALRELGIRIPDAFQAISGYTAEALYDPRPFGDPTAREAIERLKELRSALALIRKPARRSFAQEPMELSGSGLD